MKSAAFLSSILLAVGAPAVAGTDPVTTDQAQSPQVQQQQQQQSNAAPKLDPNRKICKTVEFTGSRLAASRVCKTAAQWEAERRQAQDSGED